MKQMMLPVGAYDGSRFGSGNRCLIKPSEGPRRYRRAAWRTTRARIWHRTSDQCPKRKELWQRKRLLRPGRTDEVEMKRLKLVFLLMMSLGQYRTPVY